LFKALRVDSEGVVYNGSNLRGIAFSLPRIPASTRCMTMITITSQVEKVRQTRLETCHSPWLTDELTRIRTVFGTKAIHTAIKLDYPALVLVKKLNNPVITPILATTRPFNEDAHPLGYSFRCDLSECSPKPPELLPVAKDLLLCGLSPVPVDVLPSTPPSTWTGKPQGRSTILEVEFTNALTLIRAEIKRLIDWDTKTLPRVLRSAAKERLLSATGINKDSIVDLVGN